jgi:hypothetical protein
MAKGENNQTGAAPNDAAQADAPITKSVKLKVKESFEAFDKNYPAGSTLDLTDTKGWPQGTLERRLANGFLEYETAAA